MALFDELDEFQVDWRVFELRASHRDDMEASYRRALTDPDSLLLVAESNANPLLVGMALGHVMKPSSFSDQLALELGSVVVRRDHRGRGIATEMVRRMAAFGRQLGAGRISVRVFTGNSSAVEYWRRLGFEDRFVQLTAPVDSLAETSGLSDS
jgi:ribosomal protein S18 acetylase RimI-like enzyme